MSLCERNGNDDDDEENDDDNNDDYDDDAGDPGERCQFSINSHKLTTVAFLSLGFGFDFGFSFGFGSTFGMATGRNNFIKYISVHTGKKCLNPKSAQSANRRKSKFFNF
uniref:Uncharacterized protein n=1 Tax=Glossina brevipalpis TaxID=37001 RepID=A0A1A9WIW9_9MUSC